jgi:hypothetical protein
MARSHARISTSIWADRDFLARTGEAQRLYMQLLSQPDLSHAGKLSLTTRRWSRMRADADEAVVRAALLELDESRFLVVDEDTEEVLIRSLIRNDGVWKQPKVLAVAIVEASRIVSPKLRAAIFDELVRLDTSGLPDSTEGAVKALLAELPDALTQAHAELAPDSAEPRADAPRQGGTEGGHQGGAQGDRGTRTRAGGPYPYPSPDPLPLPVPPPAGAATPRTPSAGDVVAAYMDGAKAGNQPIPSESLRNRVGKQARPLLAAAKSDAELAAIVAAARSMGATGWNDLAVQIQRDAAAAKSTPARGQREVYRNPTDPNHYDDWSQT